jgi:hypothetical protein
MATPLHTIVGFVAKFPGQSYTAEPAGKELAVFLHSELVKAGFPATAPEDYEGWAWDICTRDGDSEVTTRVGWVEDMVPDPPRQWLVTNDSYTITPFLKSLFGKGETVEAAAKREKLLRSLCESLHKFMSSDSRFSKITWCDERTFDKPGDVPSDKP